MLELQFLPKLLLQHDASPEHVLHDVQAAFLAACRARRVHASLSPRGDGLAVALGQRLVLLNLFDRGGGGSGTPAGSPDRPLARRSDAARHAAVEFVTAVDAPETITALAWLAAGAQSADECVLVGTSAGCVQLHSAATGARLLRQPLHAGPVAAAAVRWAGCGLDPGDRSEDVSLAFADAVVRLPAWEVWAAVRWAAGRGGDGGGWWGGGGGGQPHQLGFSKFSLPRGSGARTHAVCLGPPPPSLHAALTGRAERHARLVRILAVGAEPPLASFEAEESAAPGLLSLVSDLASSTAASLFGAARSYVPRPGGRSLLGLRRGGGEGGGGGQAAASAAQQEQARRRKDKIPAEPAAIMASVWDDKRAVTQLALSPDGRWAAAADSLGRVLLLDTARTLVVRLLKGYREAQVAWLVRGGGGARLAPRLAPAGGSDSSLASLGSAAGGRDGSASDLAALPQLQGSSREQQQGAQQPDGSLANGHAEPAAPPAARQQQQQQHQPEAQRLAPEQGQRQQQRLPLSAHLLVIYAPRRAVVELWDPHALVRVGATPCTTQLGLLLQQPARLVGSGMPGGPAPFQPNRCLLLDAAALTLTDLTDQLTCSL